MHAGFSHLQALIEVLDTGFLWFINRTANAINLWVSERAAFGVADSSSFNPHLNLVVDKSMTWLQARPLFRFGRLLALVADNTVINTVAGVGTGSRTDTKNRVLV
jgi:hypothetical protein